MASGPPCYKVILCGEYGVGKSSLFRRFLDNSFTEDTGPRSTIGLDHFAKTFKVYGKPIKIDLWDTAGIERFATLSASYFQSAVAAIMVYSVDDRESFSMLSQHMLDVIMHSETCKLFLCGNKVDLGAAKEQVTAADVEDFQIQCDTVVSGIYRTSCQEGDGVKEMFEDISRILHMHAELRFDPSRIQPQPLPPEYVDEKKKCCSTS